MCGSEIELLYSIRFANYVITFDLENKKLTLTICNSLLAILLAHYFRNCQAVLITFCIRRILRKFLTKQKITKLSISPVKCSYCILKIQNAIFDSKSFSAFEIMRDGVLELAPQCIHRVSKNHFFNFVQSQLRQTKIDLKKFSIYHCDRDFQLILTMCLHYLVIFENSK